MSHTMEWKVRLQLFENDEGATRANATLDTGAAQVTGHGTAHRHPADTDVPEIGDELAAGRAMRDLAQRLLSIAEHDVEGMQVPRAEARPTVGQPR
ncbi:DUF1876 domain-containing protein [Streptomyces sp. WMMB303]|uniref:DUF1876 domain-containing protein n=1 Tax=Streptomyces sp. WMMB303 TaxID=3034154 RepID=UPI0023EE25A7|nr:DUF1876 domain-containing protein [Streptomyces sp. WMMB303]MDF4252175.1 DUF1876 domain-containing protein [Streptomyces sp. WMMB303]